MLSYMRLRRMEKGIISGKPLADLQIYRETIKLHDGIGDSLIPDSADPIELGNSIRQYIKTRKGEKLRNCGVGGTLLAGAAAALYAFTPVGDYVSSQFSGPPTAVSQEPQEPSMKPIIRKIDKASQAIEEKAVEGGKDLERSKAWYVRSKRGNYTVPFNRELETLQLGDRPLLDVKDLSLGEGEVVIYAIDPSQPKEKVVYQITLVGEAFKQFKEYSDTKKNLFDNKFYLFIPSDGKIRFDHHLTGRQPAAVCSSLAEMLDPEFMKKIEKKGMELDGRYLPITIDDLEEGLRFSDYTSFDPGKKPPAEVIKTKAKLLEREKELEKRAKSWRIPNSTEDAKSHDKLNAKIDKGCKNLGSRIDARSKGVEKPQKTLSADIGKKLVQKPEEIDNFEPWDSSYQIKDIELFPDGDISIELPNLYRIRIDGVSGGKWRIQKKRLKKADEAVEAGGSASIKFSHPEVSTVRYDRKNKLILVHSPRPAIIGGISN